MNIPIDNELQAFDNHLKKNDRVIFSAPFGDGKSYFLNQFQKNYNDDYVFITLYPVNYQVVENYDVFELIKRDILVQLIATGIFVSENIVIPDGIYAYYYLLHSSNLINLEVEDLMPLTDVLNLDQSIVNKFLATRFIWNVLHKIKVGFDDYKKKLEEGKTENKIMQYLDAFKAGKGLVYEFDITSFLISSIIKNFKAKYPDRNIVLCVEDLDRLDPAHIFRILNILTAHVDRQFISFEEQEKFSIRKNKFGFDKTVVVCDYNKLQALFLHFYGKEANFDGYISKFTSSNPFFYSFRKKVSDKLIDCIESLVHFDDDVLKNALASKNSIVEKIHDLNIRQLEYIVLDVERDIKDERIEFPDHSFMLAKDVPMIKVFVIFNRLGLLRSQYNNCVLSLFESGNLATLKDLNYMLLFGFKEETVSTSFSQKISDDNLVVFIHKNQDGQLDITLKRGVYPQKKIDYGMIINKAKFYLL